MYIQICSEKNVVFHDFHTSSSENIALFLSFLSCENITGRPTPILVTNRPTL